jgi:hypothetical protein
MSARALGIPTSGHHDSRQDLYELVKRLAGGTK